MALTYTETFPNSIRLIEFGFENPLGEPSNPTTDGSVETVHVEEVNPRGPRIVLVEDFTFLDETGIPFSPSDGTVKIEASPTGQTYYPLNDGEFLANLGLAVRPAYFGRVAFIRITTKGVLKTGTLEADDGVSPAAGSKYSILLTQTSSGPGDLLR